MMQRGSDIQGSRGIESTSGALKGRNRFVLTGAPGLGKSALLPGLRSAGFVTYAEVARTLIDRWRIEGPKELSPWQNRVKFDEAIAVGMQRDYDSADTRTPTVFDRGLPDLIAWKRYYQLPVDGRMLQMVEQRPYERIVFMTPDWAPWYTRESDRPYDYEQTIAINAELRRTYHSMGYEISELPRSDVPIRVSFIVERVGAQSLGRGNR